MSKTQDAIALVDQGMSVLKAAAQIGVSHNTVYLALKKRRAKANLVACPCCRSLVEKSRINQEVLTEIKRG